MEAATSESLYTEIEPITDGGTDHGTTGDSGTDAGDTGTDSGISEQPKRRGRKPGSRNTKRTATVETISDTSPVHSVAQLRGLKKSLTLTAKGLFAAIARVRTMSLGFIPDPTSPTGFLIKTDEKGNRVPVGAGDCWLLEQKDAVELADAWGEVIALYAPPELVHRGATIGGALSVTAMVVATRLFADVQTQAMIQQVNLMRGEMMQSAAMPGMSPNGTSYTPVNVGTTEPLTSVE